MIMNGKLNNRLKTHYLTMLIMSLIFSLIFYVLWKPGMTAIPLITYTSGYISIFLLAVSLLLGPVNLMLKRKNPISTYVRRDIGIFGGILCVIHSVIGLFMHFSGRPWMYFVKEAGETFALRSDNFGLANYTGVLGAILLVLLLAISNNYFLRKLKAKRWKNLQRFSYLMFILAIAHSIFYRLSANKVDLILYLYLPMFLLILMFQLIGMLLKLQKAL